MADHLDLARLYNARSLDELRQAYDAWADNYDSQIFDDYGFRGHEFVVAAARNHLGDDAHILDAGAGSGMLGVAARAAGFRNIDAMDLSVGMLEKARERGVYGDVRTGTLGEPLDYASDSYDAVLSSGVFTPGHAPPESFRELVRIVKPGGILCFTLRHDVTPEGFHEAMDSLVAADRWELVEAGEPFQSMPGGEPDVYHRIWIYRVLG